MLSQSAKHEVRGERGGGGGGRWRIFKLQTTREIFLIQHTQQRIASHPRVLQCGWKYLSRDFLKRKPSPPHQGHYKATTNPNC